MGVFVEGRLLEAQRDLDTRQTILIEWYDKVRATLYRRFGEVDEDMMQEVMLRINRGIDQYTPDRGAKENTWLVRVMNAGIGKYLKEKVGTKSYKFNKNLIYYQSQDFDFINGKQNPEEIAIANLFIKDVLNTLSPRQKLVSMMFAAGFITSEIAIKLNLHHKYINKVQKHSRNKLRRWIM